MRHHTESVRHMDPQDPVIRDLGFSVQVAQETTIFVDKYSPLDKKYPQIGLHISALGQLERKVPNAELSDSEREALLLFSLWTEDPLLTTEIAEQAGVSERELYNCVDAATYDLDLYGNRLLKIIDDLKPKFIASESPIPELSSGSTEGNIVVEQAYPIVVPPQIADSKALVVDPFEQRYDHPILTREQEYIAFDLLKNGASIEQLMRDERFVSTISTQDKPRFDRISGQSKTIEDFFCGCNLRLVDAMARAHRYRDTDVSLQDRINAGNIGLLNAVRRFDHLLGNKLSTYAVWSIRMEIDRAVREGSAIYISRGTRQDLGKLRWIVGAFQTVFNRKPTNDELRQQLIANTELSISRIDNALDVSSRRLQLISSIHEKISSDSEDERVDFISDKKADVETDVLQQFTDDETKELVRAALDEHLTEEERGIVKSVYGIDDVEKTLDEVAKERGRHRYEIDAIRQRSLSKLRRDLRLRAVWEGGEVPSFVYHLSAEAAAFRLGLFTDPFDILRQEEKEEPLVQPRHGILFVPPAEKEPEAKVEEIAIPETASRQIYLTDDEKQAIIESLTDRQREVLELLREGLSHSAIGERLGTGSATVSGHVSKILRVVGEKAPQIDTTRRTAFDIFKNEDAGDIPSKSEAARKVLTDRNEEVLTLLNEGLSQGEIARRFNVTRQAVSLQVKKLVELGILQESESPVRSEEYWEAISTQVKNLRKKGLSYSEIAEKVPLTAATVCKWVQRMIEGGELEPPKVVSREDFKRAAISEETEVVRRYIEENSRFSYRDTLRFTSGSGEHTAQAVNGKAANVETAGISTETTEFGKQVLELINQGNSRRKTGEKLGVPVTTIDSSLTRMVRLGQYKPGRITKDESWKKLRFHNDNQETVKKLIQEGLDVIQIAEKLDKSTVYVQDVVGRLSRRDEITPTAEQRKPKNRVGYVDKNAPVPTGEAYERVARLRREGKRNQEIAEILTLPVHRVEIYASNLIRAGVIPTQSRGGSRRTKMDPTSK